MAAQMPAALISEVSNSGFKMKVGVNFYRERDFCRPALKSPDGPE
jgi:hypothetical protein